jgi:hypothetical protein
MVPMKIRHGEFQAADRGPQAAAPLDLSRHSGVAAKADGIRAGAALSAPAESSAPSSRCDGANPPGLLGRRHDPPAFPRRKVGPPSCGLGPARVSLSKRGPAASLRLSAGQRSSSLGWLRTRSRAHASTPNVTVIHVAPGICRTRHVLRGLAATVSRVKPQRFRARLISGSAGNGHGLAVTRSGNAVAVRRGEWESGAVHRGLCPHSARPGFYRTILTQLAASAANPRPDPSHSSHPSPPPARGKGI